MSGFICFRNILCLMVVLHVIRNTRGLFFDEKTLKDAIDEIDDTADAVINETHTVVNESNDVVNDFNNVVDDINNLTTGLSDAINSSVAKNYTGEIVNTLSRYLRKDWTELFQDVIYKLDKTQIPLVNLSDILQVNVSFAPLALQNYDEVSGDISIAASLVVSWVAENLPEWDPKTAFDGRERISIDSRSIWTPDFAVLRPSTGSAGKYVASSRLKVSYKQHVTWDIITVIEATCPTPDVTKFPFDEQKCSIPLALWGYDDTEVGIKAVMEQEYKKIFQGQKGGWNLLETSVKGRNNRMPDFTISLRLSRMHGYFVLNILLPPILLCVLNPCVFLLPVESGERVSFAITCFLSFSVFTSILADNMPKGTPDMAILSYFLLYMLFQSTGLMFSVIISFRMFQNHGMEREIPKWIILVAKWTRALTCPYRKTKPMPAQTSAVEPLRYSGDLRRRSSVGFPHLQERAQNNKKTSGDKNSSINVSAEVITCPTKVALHGRKSRLASITSEVEVPPPSTYAWDQENVEEITWQTASRAFDTLFFFLCVFGMSLALLMTLSLLGVI